MAIQLPYGMSAEEFAEWRKRTSTNVETDATVDHIEGVIDVIPYYSANGDALLVYGSTASTAPPKDAHDSEKLRRRVEEALGSRIGLTEYERIQIGRYLETGDPDYLPEVQRVTRDRSGFDQTTIIAVSGPDTAEADVEFSTGWEA